MWPIVFKSVRASVSVRACLKPTNNRRSKAEADDCERDCGDRWMESSEEAESRSRNAMSDSDPRNSIDSMEADGVRHLLSTDAQPKPLSRPFFIPAIETRIRCTY